MTESSFYVGYLPLPPAWRGFVRVAGAISVLLALGATLVLAFAQPGAGDGSWDDDEIALEGVLSAEPYPLLRATDPSAPGESRAWLLVSEGKHGTAERVAKLLVDAPQKRVRVHGLPLRRRDQRVLELVDGDRALEVLGDAEALTAEVPAAITLRGEIIDPKCWLGAMRPGTGLVHRACAALCIEGGIPPCFVGGPSGEAPRFYVLTDAQGAACNDAVAEKAGLLVEMNAEHLVRGGVDYLRVDPASIVFVAGGEQRR